MINQLIVPSGRAGWDIQTGTIRAALTFHTSNGLRMRRLRRASSNWDWFSKDLEGGALLSLNVEGAEVPQGPYRLEGSEIRALSRDRQELIVRFNLVDPGLNVTFHLVASRDQSVLAVWWEIRSRDRRLSLFDPTLIQFTVRLPNIPVEIIAVRGSGWESFAPGAFQVRRLWPYNWLNSVTIDNGKSGRSSSAWLPYVLCFPRSGIPSGREGIFAAIGWSGNWKIQAGKTKGERFTICASLDGVAVALAPGRNFVTPISYLGLSEGNEDAAANTMAQFTRSHVFPAAPWPDWPPVEYNTWWQFNTNINERLLVREADLAAEAGIEAFFVDAGWYRGYEEERRVRASTGSARPEPVEGRIAECGLGSAEGDFSAGLGDWIVDEKKFPNGLRPLVKHVQKKGLRFGLWFEPERVWKESHLAREHPEWLAKIESASPKARDRLLCFGIPEVQEWALATISRMVEELGIDWVKWDFNYSPGLGCKSGGHGHGKGEGLIAYVDGVYRVHREIVERFPRLLLEGCASGGNRIDLGLARYVHAFYLSDPTYDPLAVRACRQGAGFLVPPERGILWGYYPCRDTFEEMRSRHGGFTGISADLGTLDSRNRRLLARVIREYKEHIRPFLGKEIYYLSGQSGSWKQWDALQLHDPEADGGVVLAFRNRAPSNDARIVLTGVKGVNLEVTHIPEPSRRRGAVRLISNKCRLNTPSIEGSVLFQYKRSK